MGHSKQIFSGIQFQYESTGVVFNDECADIFNRWSYLIPQNEYHDLYQICMLEMEKRVDEKSLAFFENSGPHFRLDIPDGYRHYPPLSPYKGKSSETPSE